jgi:hypothetical protein
MNERKNIFAWTAPGADMPAFVSINQVGDAFEVIVRSPKELGGHTAQVTLDEATFDRLSFETFNHDGCLEP